MLTKAKACMVTKSDSRRSQRQDEIETEQHKNEVLKMPSSSWTDGPGQRGFYEARAEERIRKKIHAGQRCNVEKLKAAGLRTKQIGRWYWTRAAATRTDKGNQRDEWRINRALGRD